MPIRGDADAASAFLPDVNTTPTEHREMKKVQQALQIAANNDALVFRALSLMTATDAALADGDTAVARPDATTVARFTGKARIRVQTPVAAAAGESALYKVKVNGAVPTQKGVLIDANTAIDTWVAGDWEVPVVEGDTIVANLDYTAGGAPTPLANVLIEVDIIPVG